MNCICIWVQFKKNLNHLLLLRTNSEIPWVIIYLVVAYWITRKSKEAHDQRRGHPTRRCPSLIWTPQTRPRSHGNIPSHCHGLLYEQSDEQDWKPQLTEWGQWQSSYGSHYKGAIPPRSSEAVQKDFHLSAMSAGRGLQQ